MSQELPPLLIFTDLDGTLLDHETYHWEPAKEALDLCRANHIPVIPVSSKTRAEMEIIHSALRLDGPFVSENGGGVFFPQEIFPEPPFGIYFAESEGYWKWSFGTPYHELVEALNKLRQKLGWTIRGFSDMTIKEIADLTGLDHQQARLASSREFDEPFILPDAKADLRILEREIRQLGLKLSTGGRFHHLHGQYDKGEAVDRLINWYRKTNSSIVTVALGDSPNDFSMLKRVQHPVLVHSSKSNSLININIPGLRTTREPGPRGWNAAVLDLLDEKLGGGNS
jgi:mannosyl-3-phosphoglycerate phosphatase